MTIRLATLALVLFPLAGAEPAKTRTAVERLGESHLEAVRQARLKWSKERSVQPLAGIYHDYRAVIHVHAEDANHTLGTRDQVLKAAKETGVNLVMWTDHRGPKPETWTGSREGVLFMAGSEDDHALRFPGPDGDLKFLSHIEEIPPDSDSTECAGMEIYNRHTDAETQKEFSGYIKRAVASDGEFRKLENRFKQYPDEVFAAGTGTLPQFLTRFDSEIQKRRFTAIAANDAHRNTVLRGVVFDPYEVSFRHASTHILARELTEASVRQSLREGHTYVAHDWLCDPAGFTFVAANNFGVYDIGDRVPMLPNTRLYTRFPVPAHAKLILKGAVVAESRGAEFNFTPKEPGAYRLEAWLEADGEERPWLFTSAMYLYTPGEDDLRLPSSELSPNVKAERNIAYVEGDQDDQPKHKLDLYLPADKTNFPILFFVHGGSWRSGDRSLYAPLGNRFAKLGFGVVVPSYRFMPKYPHPAQVEDAAAAFGWTVKNIAAHGGDPSRIYVAGHSAGGHLVSLLALDGRYLAKYQLSPKNIAGVMSLSGVYDVRTLPAFGDEQTRKAASPIEYVNRESPRFLITYCQWDYPALPAQARLFDRALRRNFAESELVYIPGENHISEVAHMPRDDDPTARAMLRFMAPAQR